MSATWEVGSAPAGDSPYGLHDMAGNVEEWTLDAYGAYGSAAVTDPFPPGSYTTQVTRGGSFTTPLAGWVRAGMRDASYCSNAGSALGLRCAKPYP